jgi:hypothetical protein
MDNPMRIKFEDIDLESTEGQLLLCACALHTGSVSMEMLNSFLEQLSETHNELCFLKEVDEVIDSIENNNK